MSTLCADGWLLSISLTIKDLDVNIAIALYGAVDEAKVSTF